MAYKIILENRAIQEIDDAYNWYESQKRGLGMDFMVELYDYFGIISQSPKIFPIDFKHYRRAVLKRFSKYMIIYSIENKEVYVLSVFNIKQNPNRKYRNI